MGQLSKLGKSAGWRKMFSGADDMADPFIAGKVTGQVGPNPSGMSSRGFAGTSNRNPLMPDYAAKGPMVEQAGWQAGVNPRMRKTTVGKNPAKDAQEALRADHVDNSTLGRLRRLMSTKAGGIGAGVAGGIGAGAMLSGGEEDLDPEILQMLAMRQGGY
jgi:hypothetical protein